MKLSIIIATANLDETVEYMCTKRLFTCTHKSDKKYKKRFAIIRPFQSNFYIKLIENMVTSKYQHLDEGEHFLGLEKNYENIAEYIENIPQLTSEFAFYDSYYTLEDHIKKNWALFKDPDEYRIFINSKVNDFEKAAAAKNIENGNRWTSFVDNLDFQLKLTVRNVYQSSAYYKAFDLGK